MKSKKSPKPGKQCPRLTVRSAAEMLEKEDQEIVTQLFGQKYPEAGDNVFRCPYYQTPIRGMNRFFRDGRSGLTDARAEIQSFRQPARREHCNRVLDSFERSSLARRKLKPVPNRRFYAMVDGVELRLSPDLQVNEDGEIKIIYFNCRNARYSSETAKRMVEIAWWVLHKNGVDIRPDQIEFVDLFTGEICNIDSVRAETIKALSAEALKVSRMWETM